MNYPSHWYSRLVSGPEYSLRMTSRLHWFLATFNMMANHPPPHPHAPGTQQLPLAIIFLPRETHRCFQIHETKPSPICFRVLWI